MIVRYLALISFMLVSFITMYSGDAKSEQSKIDRQIVVSDQFVLDQNAKQLHFYRDLIKNKTVAINFIFTACFSSCPLSTAIFSQVQKKLGKQKVQFITISVDPVNDTPERLREFSDKFRTGPAWTFVTGEKAEITNLLKSLGAYSADKNEHSNGVIIGNDAKHQWTRLYGLPQADEIITAINTVSSAGKHR